MKDVLHFHTDEDITQYQSNQIVSRGTLIIASIADLHFPINNIGPKLQFSILDEQFIQKIENLPKLDIITVLGDLYEHKVLASSDAVLYASMFIGKLIEICKRKNCTLIVIQGTQSHDANQLKMYYHYMNDQYVDVRIVTHLKFEYVKNTKILCIPELYGIDETVYRYFLYESGFYDIAIMHGMFSGAVSGGDNIGSSRVFRIEDFQNCRGPILSGHVHKPGTFKDHFYYCGSPYAWRHDDDHDKGFILMALNLDTFHYYLDWIPIKSFIYRTIGIDEIINNDPQAMISYINRIKQEEGIDYIRIQFHTQMTKMTRMIINQNYQNDPYVKLEFPSTEEEILLKQKENQMNENIEKYGFILSKMTDEEKFCMYVNMIQEDETYITVQELRSILEENIE